jgi:hypothetical protein
MFANLPASLDLEGIDEVCVPRDWGWNFQDCDALIVFADPAIGAVVTLAPTAYYCPDLAVRIVPESAAVSVDDDYWRRQTDAFRMWRQSTILTSDQATVEDVVGYAGVRRERIQLIPNILDIAPIEAKAASGSMTLAWLVGSAALHDLKNAAKGLQTYLSEGGRLEPIIVRDGLREAEFSAVPFYSEGLPQSVADFLYGLPTQTVESDRELFRLLARTCGIWSSRVAGGEGEMPLLAGELGLPFFGADYGSNRFFAAADSALYSLNDPLAIADGLHAFEEQLANASPSTPRPKVPLEEKRDILRNVILDLSERGVGT